MGNLTDSFPAASSSNVLEIVHGSCDGRSITVGSGTYTLQNVTAIQNLSTSYADITGSSISYAPPSGTRYVCYRFNFKWGSANDGSAGISHWYVDIDGTEVSGSYQCISSIYSGNHSHEHAQFPDAAMWATFDLTASADSAANSEFASWTSAKTIKVRGREYNSTYQATAHYNRYRNGTTASGVYAYNKPNLSIIALS